MGLAGIDVSLARMEPQNPLEFKVSHLVSLSGMPWSTGETWRWILGLKGLASEPGPRKHDDGRD